MNNETENSVLVTGAAGFIGFHTCLRLIKDGKTVIGLDSLDPYYDVQLKLDRVKILSKYRRFTFERGDLCHGQSIIDVLKQYNIKSVIHLAAQAGVRHSFDDPKSYLDNNVLATFNLLDALKNYPVENFIYSSTSSIYGDTNGSKCDEEMSANNPVSLYAATKKSCEALIHSYTQLHNLNATIVRFFTVYGPWGRPDMALFKFTKAILGSNAIDLHNYGNMTRDFTYVDDLVDSLCRLMKTPSNYQIVNIGNSKPITLMQYVTTLENKLGKKAEKNFIKIQPGEVKDTYAENSKLIGLIGQLKYTTVENGIEEFVKWYVSYYDVSLEHFRN